MPTDEQSFAAILAEIKRKAGWNPQRAETAASITVIRQVSKFIGIKIRSFALIARGPDYYVDYDNKLTNPNFDSDLIGWTETDSVGSGVSQRSTLENYIDINRLSISSLEISCNTGTGEVIRYQQVAASPGEVWSIEARVKPLILIAGVSADAILRLEFRDSGSSLLGSAVEDTYSPAVGFQTLSIENQTAPASTAYIRVSLVLKVDTGLGTIYFNNIVASKTAALIDWEERGIVGASKVVSP